MIGAGRWPALQLTRDASCFRERINKERAHGRVDRPSTVASIAPAPYRVPNPGYTWKPLNPFQTAIVSPPRPVRSPRSPSGADPRGFGHAFAASQSGRASTPYAQFSPPVTPFTYEHTRLPPRTPEHMNACAEMTAMNWFEPPLVMSRNYSEPRGFFNSCLERSTRSVANPAAPLVPWKVKFTG